MLESNCAALDVARASNVQRCLQRKNAVAKLIASLNPGSFERLFNFREPECIYGSLKVLPTTGNLIDALAIIDALLGHTNMGYKFFSDNFGGIENQMF